MRRAWALAFLWAPCACSGGDMSGETGESTSGSAAEESGSETGEPALCEPAVDLAAQDVTDAELGALLETDVGPFSVHVGVVDETTVRVAWIATGDDGPELRINRVVDGTPESLERLALPSTTAVLPDFTTAKDGTLLAAWVDADGALQLSWARPDQDTELETVDVSGPVGVGEPTIAVVGDAGVVAWYQGQYELHIARFSIASGAIEVDTPLAVPHTVNRTFGVLAPDVGIDEEGMVRLSWDDIEAGSMYPDSPDVFMIARTPSETWSPAFNISQSVLHHSSESFVIRNDEGWHLAWVEQNHGADITNFEVWYAFENAGEFTTPLDVSREGLTNNILSPQWPRIGIDCPGSASFGWFSRPPDRPDASALFHVAPDAVSPFVPVFAAEMNRDAGWAIDGAGVHHFAWVSPASLTGTTGVRYLRIE